MGNKRNDTTLDRMEGGRETVQNQLPLSIKKETLNPRQLFIDYNEKPKDYIKPADKTDIIDEIVMKMAAQQLIIRADMAADLNEYTSAIEASKPDLEFIDTYFNNPNIDNLVNKTTAILKKYYGIEITNAGASGGRRHRKVQYGGTKDQVKDMLKEIVKTLFVCGYDGRCKIAPAPIQQTHVQQVGVQQANIMQEQQNNNNMLAEIIRVVPTILEYLSSKDIGSLATTTIDINKIVLSNITPYLLTPPTNNYDNLVNFCKSIQRSIKDISFLNYVKIPISDTKFLFIFVEDIYIGNTNFYESSYWDYTVEKNLVDATGANADADAEANAIAANIIDFIKKISATQVTFNTLISLPLRINADIIRSVNEIFTKFIDNLHLNNDESLKKKFTTKLLNNNPLFGSLENETLESLLKRTSEINEITQQYILINHDFDAHTKLLETIEKEVDSLYDILTKTLTNPKPLTNLTKEQEHFYSIHLTNVLYVKQKVGKLRNLMSSLQSTNARRIQYYKSLLSKQDITLNEFINRELRDIYNFTRVKMFQIKTFSKIVKINYKQLSDAMTKSVNVMINEYAQNYKVNIDPFLINKVYYKLSSVFPSNVIATANKIIYRINLEIGFVYNDMINNLSKFAGVKDNEAVTPLYFALPEYVSDIVMKCDDMANQMLLSVYCYLCLFEKCQSKLDQAKALTLAEALAKDLVESMSNVLQTGYFVRPTKVLGMFKNMVIRLPQETLLPGQGQAQAKAQSRIQKIQNTHINILTPNEIDKFIGILIDEVSLDEIRSIINDDNLFFTKPKKALNLYIYRKRLPPISGTPSPALGPSAGHGGSKQDKLYYKYNGRRYKVRMGNRGGSYIKVGEKKLYIK